MDKIDAILTIAFNDFYDYIIEKDIVKAAHEYSEKTVYKTAKRQINNLLIEELSHVEPDARWFPNEGLYGAIKVSDRLAQLKAQKGDS